MLSTTQLINAELAEMHDFERDHLFESCMPVEEIARRGRQTLLFGPLKPVGLTDPHTGKRPFASCSSEGKTSWDRPLTWWVSRPGSSGESRRGCSGMIPALSNAEFMRFGVMHRNTFLNSPEHINSTMQLRACPSLFFAGQMTGVEGYIESTASGLVAGVNAGLTACGQIAGRVPGGHGHRGTLQTRVCTQERRVSAFQHQLRTASNP